MTLTTLGVWPPLLLLVACTAVRPEAADRAAGELEAGVPAPATAAAPETTSNPVVPAIVETPLAGIPPAPATAKVAAPDVPLAESAASARSARSPAPSATRLPAAAKPVAQPPIAVKPVAVSAQAATALDLHALEQRLRDTHAIGLFTKLSLKNQVDDLLQQFRAFYREQGRAPSAALRQRYDLLILKVLSLLQDSDPPLAKAIGFSREAIWGILSDPAKLSVI